MQDHCFGREEITTKRKKANRFIQVVGGFYNGGFARPILLFVLGYYILLFDLIHLTFGKNFTILSTSH